MIFENIHTKQYAPQFFKVSFGINQLLFDFLYSNFLEVNKPLEDLAIWFVKEKISHFLGKSELKLSFTKTDEPQIKSEHIYNQISSLLQQYRIFVEEGEITLDLIEETKDSLLINEYPSLIKNKYYDINPKSVEAGNIMFLLFSDQSAINYVNKDLNANNFFNLIKNHTINYEFYEGSSKQKIDYLVENSIVQIKNGYIVFPSFETSFIWDFFYENLFIPSYLVDDNVLKLLEHYVNKKICRKYSKLFSSAEADYLDYILNNSKFSDALALRNHYEHGQSSHYTIEEHEKNYLIGLRTLFLILFKIYQDLVEKRKLSY